MKNFLVLAILVNLLISSKSFAFVATLLKTLKASQSMLQLFGRCDNKESKRPEFESCRCLLRQKKAKIQNGISRIVIRRLLKFFYTVIQQNFFYKNNFWLRRYLVPEMQSSQIIHGACIKNLCESVSTITKLGHSSNEKSNLLVKIDRCSKKAVVTFLRCFIVLVPAGQNRSEHFWTVV